MRRAPRNPAPVPETLKRITGQEGEGERVIELDMTFISHLFGGGARPGRVDQARPVRIPSLRGQLRFWWRAVNPGKVTTVTALRDREEKVFGSTEAPSRLVVTCTHQPTCTAVKYSKLHEALKYGAFALAEQKGKGGTGGTPEGQVAKVTKTFRIVLRFPEEIQRDVEAALWGWCHFGGLGGRTRRGFGAVAVEKSEGWSLPTIEAGWTKYVAGESVPWPHLSQEPERNLVQRSRSSPEKAHEWLLARLKQLRQGEGMGRNPGTTPKRPGRSRWPEPDEIRRLSGKSSPRHEERLTRGHKFPRARFGLPIIFHFKDAGDPEDHALTPDTAERWASPLILRPHVDGEGEATALALLLAGSEPPENLTLEGSRSHTVKWKLTEAEAREIQPLEGERDPCRRFLDYLKEHKQ